MTTTPGARGTRTWTVTGAHFCDVNGCGRPAEIIADVCDYDRFCGEHTAEAAAVAQLYAVFKGWYRIIASHYHFPSYRVTFTVEPL